MARFIRRGLVAAVALGVTLMTSVAHAEPSPGSGAGIAIQTATAEPPGTVSGLPVESASRQEVQSAPAWKLENGRSLMAMTVKNASKANGALVIQYPFSGGPTDPTSPHNDIMAVDWYGVNQVRIKPRHTTTDMCIVVSGASVASGASIIQYECSYLDGVDNDVWYADRVLPDRGGSKVYEFRNARSGLCMAVRDASTVPGAGVIQFACNHSANSRWIMEPPY
jgi:hypothetical protein